MSQLAKLGDVFVQDTDVEEALHKSFADNWDNQRKVAEGSDNDIFTVTLYFSASVSMKDAKTALASFEAKNRHKVASR